MQDSTLMAKTLLIAEDNEGSRTKFGEALKSEGYSIIAVDSGAAALGIIENDPVDLLLTEYELPDMSGVDLLERARASRPTLPAIMMTNHDEPDAVIGALRNKAIDFLSKPFTEVELCDAVGEAFERIAAHDVEVISAKPDWIEIHVPCDLNAVEPISKFICKLQPDLSEETREAISRVFREMLNNAIEHGGKCDPSKRVEVKCIRLKRMIICSIKDPGEGFDLNQVDHAAVTNPAGEPFRHMHVRQEKGIRPGGFGILFALQLIDELIYNEKHNELMFVKYLDQPTE
jgi:CheY-like chemotaxis protein/anti-sigma regulatory factor (Ser/Thr protein kinase)